MPLRASASVVTPDHIRGLVQNAAPYVDGVWLRVPNPIRAVDKSATMQKDGLRQTTDVHLNQPLFSLDVSAHTCKSVYASWLGEGRSWFLQAMF